MDEYVSKPVKTEEVGAVLEKFAGSHHDSVVTEVVQTEAPVDLEQVLLAMGDDPEEVADILGVYLSQMESSMTRLAAAIKAGNANEVNLIAHNCAGVSASCGMVALVTPLRQLETMGREEKLAGAESVGIVVSKEFERVKAFLKEHLAGVPA